MRTFDHFIVHKKSSSAVIVLPTGVGKTGVIGCVPFGISQGRVLIIAPRLVIKDNTLEELDPRNPENFWLKRKVISSQRDLPSVIEYQGRETRDDFLQQANIVIVNIHRLQERLDTSLLNRTNSDFFDMVIIDEAHHSPAKSWVDVINYYNSAKVVKLTATPGRTDGVKIEGEIAFNYKLRRAMGEGFIKTLENIVHVPNDLHFTIGDDEKKTYSIAEIYDLNIRDEEWVSRSVAYSLECSTQIVERSIDMLRRKKENSDVPHKIIGIACSIKHALQICELYRQRDIEAVVIHSGLSTKERQENLAKIETHKVEAVINVAMLGEGYDHPFLSIAAIFRPFRNSLPYEQFIGRILRLIPDNLGYKINGSDNHGVVVSHHHLYLDTLWEYYKKEIDASKVIAEIVNYQWPENGESNGQSNPQGLESGTAKESGDATTRHDHFLDELAVRKEEEEEAIKRQKTIAELKKILPNLSDDKLEDIYREQNETEDELLQALRPDIYFSSKRKDLDATIKKEIVPDLMASYGIDVKDIDLRGCVILFGSAPGRRDYSWIPNAKGMTNGGMIATYISTDLKSRMGKSPKDYSDTDFRVAGEHLQRIVEFVDEAVKNYKLDNS